MKKYKPIRIHHLYYGYGYWWGVIFSSSVNSQLLLLLCLCGGNVTMPRMQVMDIRLTMVTH